MHHLQVHSGIHSESIHTDMTRLRHISYFYKINILTCTTFKYILAYIVKVFTPT